jgi:hypothetical protein
MCRRPAMQGGSGDPGMRVDPLCFRLLRYYIVF